MAITPSYDPSHLAPKILIHDLDGTLKYTYEAEQIAASPTQDFQLRALKLHLGINDDIGNSVLLIEDPNNALTETTARSDSKIKRQWTVQVSLGKSSADLNRWFYGKILDVEVLRPDTAVQQIRDVFGEEITEKAAQRMAESQAIGAEIPGLRLSTAEVSGSPALIATQRIRESNLSGLELEQAIARQESNISAINDFAQSANANYQ